MKRPRRELDAGPPPPLDERMIRARQRSRSLVTGFILGALALLFYAIALAKMTGSG